MFDSVDPAGAKSRLELVPLAEQARILELSHDTVIIRDAGDVILYWNRGAEALYGYSRAEAVGTRCDHLLQCDFPSAEVSRALDAAGHWAGEMTRVRRDGTRITLASRWLQRRDDAGRSIGVMETSADVTAHRIADEGRERSERRYSAIFHAAGFATWESDWSRIRRFIEEATQDQTDLRRWLTAHPDIVRTAAGKALIQEVNQAAIKLFDARGAEDLVGSSIIGRYPAGAERGFVEILAGLVEGREVVEAETRLSTLTGRPLDVILRATLVPDGEPWSRALVMAFDETERKEARTRLEQTSAELAHASRVSMLGQLAASIAHEVNQPLTAIVNYGKSGRRWLARETPDLAEANSCFERIVANGSRAAEVIARVRSLARMQAMRDVVERERELCISIVAGQGSSVRVAVRDCGTGIGGDDPARIFAPFFTTKPDGMGMGLSICRSIIEAQGGSIDAEDNPDHGATISFTLPAQGAAG